MGFLKEHLDFQELCYLVWLANDGSNGKTLTKASSSVCAV